MARGNKIKDNVRQEEAGDKIKHTERGGTNNKTKPEPIWLNFKHKRLCDCPDTVIIQKQINYKKPTSTE
jgi:hypothetical protein